MRSTAGSAARGRRRAGGLNSRVIALGVLVIACVLLLILPVSNYLRQRGNIEQLQSQITAKQASIEDLEDRNALLDDPAYVKAQARDRLNYIEPGEQLYVVANNDPSSDSASEREADEKAAQKQSTSAAEDLAASIAEADGADETDGAQE